jgi:tetratricopeptide (TPR) repeat protein
VAGETAPRSSAVPPIFGRADAVAEVERTLERALGVSGDALLLSGEDGSGKSLFARTAVQRARRLGFRVLEGRALPEDIPQPFSLVRDLVRSAERSPRLDRSDEESRAALPIFLAPYASDVSADPAAGPEGGEPASASAGLEALLAPIDSTEDWMGSSRNDLIDSLSQYLIGLAHGQPLVLVIDDLHFADASSLEFLGRFLPELTNRSVALVATVASGDRIPTRSREAIESITRTTGVRTVPLRPLTTSEVGEFARWMRRGLAPEFTDVLRWHAQTEGNPLFVEQLVRSTIGFSAWPSSALPGTASDLNDILLARVRALGEAEHRTLTYAALLGKEFAFATLAAISEMDEERVSESLDRLVEGGLLREKGNEVCEFVTEGVRAAVYGELTETRRRILHRRVGRSLEEKGLASEFELARQFYLGRDDAKAAEYNERAALTAMRAFAFETAVPHLERALESERRRPDRNTAREVHFLTELGRSLDELGDLRRSEVVLAEAVLLARTRPELDVELGRALLTLAQTRQDQSEFASSEALAREAYGRLERQGTPREVMMAHRVLGVVYWRLGRLADSEQHLRLALEIAERDGTPIERGHALIDVANAMMLRGETQFPQALVLYEQAAELFRTGQDLSARARVLMNRAMLLYAAGRTEDAFEGLARATEAAERTRSPIWMGYCYLNAAQMHAELGHPELSRPALERASALLTPLGDRLGTEQLALARGLLAEAEGEFDRAETQFGEALRQAQELDAEPEVCEMLFRLAHLAHARGDDAAARLHLAAARTAGIERQRTDLAGRVSALEAALTPTT